MDKELWTVPETLEGMKILRTRIDERLAKGDEVVAAWGSLELARVMKLTPYFEGKAELGIPGQLRQWALETFRRHDEKLGIVRTLRSSPADQSGLDEAENIAVEIGDEHELAKVWVLKANLPKLTSEEREYLWQRALEVFRRLEDRFSTAMLLFSMSVRTQRSAGLAYALESASIYREIGKHRESARAFVYAGLCLESDSETDFENWRQVAQQGLEEARTAGDPSMEFGAYRQLTSIGVANGRLEELREFIALFGKSKRPISDDDRLPENHNDRQMFRRMRRVAIKHGNHKAVALIEPQLTLLRRRGAELVVRA